MPLFDRDNRNVALTTVGAVFMEQARHLVHQMRSLERDMGLIRNSELGPLAFGAGPLPTAAFLPELLRQMGQERPGLRLSVNSNNWRYLLQHLYDEEIEFFVADTRAIQPAPTLTITPLCRQFSPSAARDIPCWRGPGASRATCWPMASPR
jgi:DNA-binding transcriptional LysR family regulator